MNPFQYFLWLAGPNANKKGPTAAAGTYYKPAPAPGSFFDDFDGPAGSPPSSLWLPVANVVRGPSISVPENATLDGDGNLMLTAAKQLDGSWLSALVVTTELMQYGTYYASIRMPVGHGIHSSFWQLGEGYKWPPDYASGTPWPQCGENDGIECIADGKYYMTVHGRMWQPPTVSNYNQSQLSGQFGFKPSQDFHLYWFTKVPGRVTYGIDNMTLGAIGAQSIPGGAPWELDQPQQTIFSVTVNDASGWGGGTDDTTPDITAMLIDWFYFHPATA